MRPPAAALLMLLAACVTDPQQGPGAVSQGLRPGEVGTVCAPARVAGTEVAASPAEGRALWSIRDTAPGAVTPRTQYVTGFSDGCARQVTAALVVFGSPAVHETLRYDPSHRVPFDATDTAYERIKGRICGVAADAPCPSARMAQLERSVTFVTIYPTFGATRGVIELLIDARGVVARSG